MDDEESVRVIAFKRSGEATIDQGTLREVRLPAEVFYGLLEDWTKAFETLWEDIPKLPATPLPS